MKKFSILLIALTLGSISLLFGYKYVHATLVSGSVTPFCEKHGSSDSCSYGIWLGPDDAAYQIDWSMVGSGFGSLGPSGGKVDLWVCFSPRGSMWDGPCSHVINDTSGNRTLCPYGPYTDWGNLGSLVNCNYNGSYKLLSSAGPKYHYMIAAAYVNDGQLRGTLTAYGDRCYFDPNASGCVVNTTDPLACSDGIDNDGDGLTDYPDDPGCTDANDNDETNVTASVTPEKPLHVVCELDPCQVYVGQQITFYLYDADGNPSDKACGECWGAFDPATPMTSRADVAALDYGVGDKGRFNTLKAGYVGINTWAGGLPEPAYLTVLAPIQFTYSLNNSGPVNVVKNTSGETYGAVAIDRILKTGSTQNVSLEITSALPAGVTVDGFSNVNCSPNCSSTITFDVSQNAIPGQYSISVKGSPNNIITTFNLNIVDSSIAATCSAAPNPALLGDNVTWTATVRSGTAPYHYVWTGDYGTKGDPGDVSNFQTTYTTTGPKHIHVAVTDAAGSSVPDCQNGNNNGSGSGGLLYVNFNPKFEEF